MKKTILFPTDFTIESLNMVKNVLSRSKEGETFDIILLHGIEVSDSITDLLFYSRNKIMDSLSNQQFDEACHIIKNKYASKINSFRKEFFTGYTQAAFNNFIEANRVEEAYYPSNYKFHSGNKKSFDVMPYLKKSNIKIGEVDWASEAKLPEKGKVAEVFYSGVPVA
jgi:hypothetical protein